MLAQYKSHISFNNLLTYLTKTQNYHPSPDRMNERPVDTTSVVLLKKQFACFKTLKNVNIIKPLSSAISQQCLQNWPFPFKWKCNDDKLRMTNKEEISFHM